MDPPPQGEMQGQLGLATTLFLSPLRLKTTSICMKSSIVVLNPFFDISFILETTCKFHPVKKINYYMPGRVPGDLLVNETKLLTPQSFLFQKTRQK